MILLLSSVVVGVVAGRFLNFQVPDNLFTILLMILVFVVGIDIGSEENILKKIKVNLKIIVLQSFFMMVGSLVVVSILSFFTQLTLKESLLAASGFGWYSLSAIMITDLYSPLLGAISFTSNVIREVIAIVIIPIAAKFSKLGAVSIAGATSMDTLLGIISKSTDKESTLIGFGQGVIVSSCVPLVISLIYNLL